MKENNAPIDNYSIAVGYGYDLQEAETFKEHLSEVLNSKGYPVADIPIYQIGATIGVHTGPYPIGIGIIERAIY